MWLGVWKNCSDQPLGLTWVTKMKILGVVFGIDNKLIWPFLWGSKIETVARKSLQVPVLHGGLNITDFKIKGEALRLASILSTVQGTESNSFYLKEKFTPEWPFIFFTPIKSLYKNMLFTKISASNER